MILTGNVDAIPGIVVRAWISYSGKTHWEEYTYQEQPLLNDSEDFLRIAVQRHVFDFNHTDAGMRYPKRLLDIEIVARKLDPLYCELIHLFPHDWEPDPHRPVDGCVCKACGCRAWRRNLRSAIVIPEGEKRKHPFGCIPHLRPI